MLTNGTQLKRVGYWRATAIPSWFDSLPYPSDRADPAWPEAERRRVLAYLKEHGRVHQSWMGYSRCRICGINNGCHDMTDGSYVWPSGYAHYIEQHTVKPPPHFIAHVLGRTGAP